MGTAARRAPRRSQQPPIKARPFIKRVHEDVWRTIFTTLYEDATMDADATNDYSIPEKAVLLVSSVCTTWRKIAQATPSLFRYIVVKGLAAGRHTAASSLGHALTKSGACLLNVSLYVDEACHSNKLHAQFRTLIPHMHRIITFRLSASDYRQIFSVEPVTLLPRDSPLTGFPLSNLRTLRFENIMQPLDHTLIFLMNAPKLEVLTIRSSNDKPISCLGRIELPNDPRTRTVRLSSLRELDIELDVLIHLISCNFSAPVLKSLSIIDACIRVMLGKALDNTRIMASLESLTLRGRSAFTDIDVVLLLYQTPALRELHLRNTSIGKIFLDMVSSPEKPPNVGFNPQHTDYLAPHLELLDIDGSSMTDEVAMRFLQARSASSCPGLKTVTLHIKNCPKTTPGLGRILQRSKRGTWTPTSSDSQELGWERLRETGFMDSGAVSAINMLF